MKFEGTERYVATDDLRMAVNAAVTLERPLLIKGEPGTGKTMLAEEVALGLGKRLIQWHIKSTTKAQQGLYEYDAVSRLRDSQLGDEKVHDIANYIKKGKLWEAFDSEEQVVLLIDEVDKADIEFPNDLLVELDRMEFFVYETGQTIKARHRPIIIITSNNEKELPDAFLRRCFFHFINFPDRDTMREIVAVHYPDITKELVQEAMEVFFDVRSIPGLKKKPSTSELIDWLKLLMADDIPDDILKNRDQSKAIPPLYGALLKNEQDVHLLERLAFMHRRESRVSVMLINFFHGLRDAGVPVTTRELLDLLEGLKRHIAFGNMDEFYYFSRTCMVKDEKYFDRFDRAFGLHFQELEALDDVIEALIPDDWLRSEFMKSLSEEDKAKIESLGGLEKLIEEFKKRLEEQKKRHQGGNKWIGTGGTSPFGQEGYHPEGIRVGPNGRNKKAVKVWEKRDFKNLDDSVELGTRNIKIAMRRLRKFARTGAADELDLDDTISSTARNAGLLDIKMVPERHNAVKVLLFFDVGGSMDPHVRVCEELFSAARTEFKHMEYFYFHNFLYESVWKNNFRRHNERTPLLDVLHKYSHDYKVIFVGDAAMSPYEIMQPGGSVEHWNEESGEVWMRRLQEVYDKVIWINPLPEEEWQYTQSVAITHKLMEGHMYPLTLKGLEEGMAYLSK